jgi:predicted O-methyltransferase YrrM
VQEFPPLVQQARIVARRLGFPATREEAGPAGGPTASLPDVGRFLAMLAAGCVGGRIGELGTGAGIGTAWIASAMPADCTLFTAEIDEQLAAAARQLFAADPRVQVITGDARPAMAGLGPFDLLFCDGGGQDRELIDWLRVGGRIVMDDVTPGRPVAGDPKREFFFTTPRLTSVEVVLPDLRNALLAGTRTR